MNASHAATIATDFFLDNLPKGKRKPEVHPDNEGHMTLLWDCRPALRIILTIEGSILYYSVEQQGKEDFFSKDIPFSIPKELLEVIPSENQTAGVEGKINEAESLAQFSPQSVACPDNPS